jgi:hypothetical protein
MLAYTNVNPIGPIMKPQKIVGFPPSSRKKREMIW